MNGHNLSSFLQWLSLTPLSLRSFLSWNRFIFSFYRFYTMRPCCIGSGFSCLLYFIVLIKKKLKKKTYLPLASKSLTNRPINEDRMVEQTLKNCSTPIFLYWSSNSQTKLNNMIYLYVETSC